MRILDPDQQESYTFLEVEQADGIKIKEVYQRTKGGVNRRIKLLAISELNDEDLININVKLITVYPMIVCKFKTN